MINRAANRSVVEAVRRFISASSAGDVEDIALVASILSAVESDDGKKGERADATACDRSDDEEVGMPPPEKAAMLERVGSGGDPVGLPSEKRRKVAERNVVEDEGR